MPLSFFDYKTFSHFREVVGRPDRYEHTFGGEPSTFEIRFVNCEPMHLIYRLNQADPAVSLGIPDLHWLPLCYHFSYAGYNGELIYRVLNDMEIELIAPTEAHFDAEFPFPNFPQSFPQAPITFCKQKYDPTLAEDALKLAAVFGVDQLSESEMKRAILIADETSGTISDFAVPDWTPEDIIRCNHREPFIQGAPSKSCDNPNCTAEIAYRTKEMTVQIDNKTYQELTGQSSFTLDARDVRRDSMRVFAIHQPEDDDRVWPDVQLVFELCECCQCIRVSNQCD